MSSAELWKRFREYRSQVSDLGLSLDVSRMNFDAGFIERMKKPMAEAFASMDALERGAIANPDEERMVGHYWLRDPDRAPTPEIATEIRKTVADIKAFATRVHNGAVKSPRGAKFTDLLCIGIGGSALGPMFVADALGGPDTDKMRVHFIDNVGVLRFETLEEFLDIWFFHWH